MKFSGILLGLLACVAAASAAPPADWAARIAQGNCLYSPLLPSETVRSL
jgi:hypothetical protein